MEQQYAAVTLSPERIKRLRSLLLEAIARRGGQATLEIKRQKKRIGDLNRQRERLVRAHLEGDAVPLDLLKREQVRITSELGAAEAALRAAETETTGIEVNVDAALALIADPQAFYRAAPPRARKHWNMAFFRKLLVDLDGVQYAEIAQPFATLVDENLPNLLENELRQPQSRRRGSRENGLVEYSGLEPLTSSLPARRSSQLS